MQSLLTIAVLLAASGTLFAQAPGKWPPDSLINTSVFPKSTPVVQVIGTMRNFAGWLGVRCQFCHVGEEGMPLAQFDFASDEKRNKLVARQMMHMVQEINRRVDTIPEAPIPGVEVTCGTCHRGTNRPIPLAQLMAETTLAFGADSAVATYRALRNRYFGRDAYDFGEFSLNSAAFRLGRERKFDEALTLLRLNEELFPGSSGMYVFRGNILLMQGDTTAAAEAYREAIRRDSSNGEARGRLRDINRTP
jgi:Photosynthetic reaction centre cytochrome C subunit